MGKKYNAVRFYPSKHCICEYFEDNVCPPMSVHCIKELEEHDKQIRADERNRVFSTLSKLIESDYNSKECKLLLSDLCETILEQLKGE